MGIKRTLILILLGQLIVNLPYNGKVHSQQLQNVSQSASSNTFMSNRQYYDINWSELELTSEQTKKIEDLNKDWERIEQLIRPKIIRDQQQLKNLMSNPNIDEDQIRKLQRDIMVRQEQLRYEATENFLSKRRILNPKQREILHKMMPR